jgi:DNA (cytosine-5)-methyltransferase 1
MAITPDDRRAWLPRLKALGNGITPAQAFVIARCILRAEGLQ